MTPGDMRTHDKHCAAHLSRLRMLASDEASPGVPGILAQQVTEITGMILAEAEAAGRTVTAATADDPRGAASQRFLAARLARMTVAAQDAVVAAERGDIAVLRRQLHRFDTLTSAMWAVLDALRPVPSMSRQRPLPLRLSPLGIGHVLVFRSLCLGLPPSSGCRGDADGLGEGVRGCPGGVDNFDTHRYGSLNANSPQARP
jgi:hypothetical protein